MIRPFPACPGSRGQRRGLWGMSERARRPKRPHGWSRRRLDLRDRPIRIGFPSVAAQCESLRRSCRLRNQCAECSSCPGLMSPNREDLSIRCLGAETPFEWTFPRPQSFRTPCAWTLRGTQSWCTRSTGRFLCSGSSQPGSNKQIRKLNSSIHLGTKI